MFSFKVSGSYRKTTAFLSKAEKLKIDDILKRGGAKGIVALQAYTPVDSGLAASSWNYIIEKGSGGLKITWTNSDIETGFPVAVMIQYGHGTGTGGYVQGIDYINPAMKPVFQQIADEVWKEVTRG